MGLSFEWVSGEWSGGEVAGELQTVVRWAPVTHTHSFKWDLVCVKEFGEWRWFIFSHCETKTGQQMLVTAILQSGNVQAGL